MKKLLLLFLTILTFNLYSQEQFNVILEDTIGHISNSVIESNGYYYVLSGTGNELGNRSFSITEVNNNGEVLRKEIFGNDTLEIWEGRNNCLNKYSNHSFMTATVKNLISSYNGLVFYEFNDDFTVSESTMVRYDTIWRQCYNSIQNDIKDVFVTGQYYDYESSNYCFFLTKYDSLENVIWHNTITDYYSLGRELIETKDRDIICGGVEESVCLIVSYNSNGEYNWKKRYGSGILKALLETTDSCILACGSYPGITTGNDTYYDGCIRKIDQEGELLWENHYRNYSGHPTNDDRILSSMSISSCDKLSNGDLIVVGSSLGYYTIDRGFMMQLSSNGKIKWHNYYYADTINSAWQYMSSFTKTLDGGFVLLGYGTDYTDEGYDPPQQRWLIKTDSLGMDGLCNTEPDALEVDIDFPEEMCAFDTTEQYLYIAGPTAPYTVNISNGQQFDSIYYPPVFLPKEIGPGTIEVPYSSTTNLTFEEPEVTIANHEWGECIAIPIEYYVGNQVGFVNVDITVTDGWGNSKTTSRTVFVKTCPAALEDSELLNLLQVYPNPASDFLTVEFQENHQSVPVSIIDMHGKGILIYQLTGEKTIIDISALSTGNYQLMIKGISKSFTVAR